MSLEIWNKFAKPPLTALKKIGAGRLSGKTDINPQWRYQALTEEYGPCGLGWKFTVEKLWTEPAPDGQVFCFAHVNLYVFMGCAWSAPIPGYGGSMLVSKESKGLYANDEGYKMAITDALGTAAKMLGVAAEIYLGNFDGSKYRDEAPSIPERAPQPSDPRESKTYHIAPEREKDVPEIFGKAEPSEKDIIDSLKQKLSGLMLGFKAAQKKEFYDYVVQGNETVDVLQAFVDDYFHYREKYMAQKGIK